jgi:F1F0 ATPase subunit 2
MMFGAGLVLGAFYFLGLWQTVKRLPYVSSRVGFMAVSFGLRAVLVTTALFFLMDGRWEKAAAALIGFIVMRKILTSRLGLQNIAAD